MNTQKHPEDAAERDAALHDAVAEDARQTLQGGATDRGRSDGWDHANHVTAYGGDMDAEPEVPGRFATVATYYTAAYADGIQDYQTEAADAEEELSLINATPGNVNGEMARWCDGAETDQREAWADFVEYAGAEFVEAITPDQFESEIYQGQHASMQDFADQQMEDTDDGQWTAAMELLQSRGYHRPDVDEIAWQQDYYMSESGHVFTTNW